MDNWLSQLAAFSVLGLLLFTGVSTATSSFLGDDEQADGDDVVFSRDYIIIGQRPWTWNESFSTSPDCESVRLNVTIGPMMTGSFGVYIRSVDFEKDIEHTIYGSPFQILGFPILGTGGYYYTHSWFVPGEQIIQVGSVFCFGAFHVEVTEAPWPPAPHGTMANPISTLL
ncbi:MAG: hypothetical protein R6U10_07430 [Thermoplasmatota archaeon]